MKRLFVIAIVLSGMFASAASAVDLVLAAASSTRSSGLISKLIPAFEKDTGIHIRLYIVGSGKALKMGRKGEIDLMLVHSPGAEIKFVDDGYGVLHTRLMKNEFLIVGPANDPAKINGLTDVQQAFKNIYRSNSLFISRADDSGTHNKETGIWRKSGIEPYGDWYFEFGGKTKETMLMADEKQAYVMVDSGSWLRMQDRVTLKPYVRGDSMLDNVYSLIAVNPKLFRKKGHKHAKAFIKWIRSEKGLKIISNLTIENEKLYTILP